MTDHNKIDTDIINAWTEASKNLGLQIQTPFTLQLDKEQGEEFVLLIKDFGSKLGTVVLTDIHKSPSQQLRQVVIIFRHWVTVIQNTQEINLLTH